MVGLVNLIGQAAQGLYNGTDIEELTIVNIPEHDDVQWTKHMLPCLG